jgi:hypothetical protein
VRLARRVRTRASSPTRRTTSARSRRCSSGVSGGLRSTKMSRAGWLALGNSIPSSLMPRNSMGSPRPATWAWGTTTPGRISLENSRSLAARAAEIWRRRGRSSANAVRSRVSSTSSKGPLGRSKLTRSGARARGRTVPDEVALARRAGLGREDHEEAVHAQSGEGGRKALELPVPGDPTAPRREHDDQVVGELILLDGGGQRPPAVHVAPFGRAPGAARRPRAPGSAPCRPERPAPRWGCPARSP